MIQICQLIINFRKESKKHVSHIVRCDLRHAVLPYQMNAN